MNFNLSSGKSEYLHFDEIFLSKLCNVWDNPDELSREKWIMVSKMTYAIWWIFTEIVESNVR